MFGLAMGLVLGGILWGQSSHDSLVKAGRLAYLEGDYTAAIETYIEYYRVASDAGDDRATGDALRLLGDAFRASHELEEAITQLEMGLQKANLAKDSTLIGRIYNRLAAVYFEMGEMQACEQSAQTAIQLSEKVADKVNISSTLNILGAVYRIQGQYQKALDALNESISLQKAVGDTADIPSALNNISSTLLQMKRYDEAISVAKKSYAMADRAGIPAYTSYASELLVRAYRAKNDFEQALRWQDQFLQIDQKMMNETKTKEISKLRQEMDMARKEKDLELLKNESALKDQTIAQKNVQAVAFGCIGILVLLLALLSYASVRRQKQANRALMLKNEQIEHQAKEISAINASLERVGQEQERQKLRLEEINKVKDKLFSIISHDLRSPLNSIQGLLDLLKQGNLNDREFNYMAAALMSRVENTTMLLDNLLNWSRSQMEGFTAQPDRIDLGHITQAVCLLLDYNARAKEIQLENRIPAGMEALGDKIMIDLVIRNLLSNAIKFTQQGGYVQIWANREQGEINIAVKDDGAGISDADLARVMGEDYYFTLGTANERGSGLGLRLCKEFLQKNNGRLWVEQNSDRGSTFWFSVPTA